MWLQVNPRSSVPMYQQVIEGVKTGVAKGVLRAGDKLPAVRELAVELTINHNTVAKAYQELERENVIEVIRGRGTFIALQPTVPNADARKQELREAMTRWIIEAHHLQMSDDELLRMFREVTLQWKSERGGEKSEPGGRDDTPHQGI